MDEMDLEELKEMFLEECREHVDTLERGFLEMSQAEQSVDLLNEVFRAAHSIKGGGATFGFADLAELTHHMETLLDQMRSGEKPIEEADVELLLESLDVVRELMESLGNDDHPQRLILQERLEKAVVKSDNAETDESAKTAPTEQNETVVAEKRSWLIHFQPKLELMQRGNDPLLMIRELQRIGELQLDIDFSALPPWENYDAKLCYLPWNATLTTSTSEDDIHEIFEWVEFDCDITITEVSVEPENVEDLVASADSVLPATLPAPQPPKSSSPPAAQAAKPKPAASTESSSIRVSIDKVNQLINMVGELVITQSMLSGLTKTDEPIDPDQLRDRLAELERNTRQLQESVMRVRMLPMSTGFARLPRLVRDLSKKLDKTVNLVVEGAETEIDKTVLEQMMDPLVHLVRNAVDHGLETHQERLEAGKPKEGELKLSAYHKSSSVIIEISDDGKGIDAQRILAKAIERGIVDPDDNLSEAEIHRLIFAPGFSTAEVVSDVSGRGVGMDVVRRNILDLGGQVDLHSVLGTGTCVTIQLPLTLAILDGQLISSSGEVFVIPLASIIETLEVSVCNISSLPRSGAVFEFRDQYLPLIYLKSELDLPGEGSEALIVVIESNGRLFGIAFDQVLGQQQIVIKALEDNYQAVRGIAGATIMSDGSVALILDPAALAPEVRANSAA